MFRCLIHYTADVTSAFSPLEGLLGVVSSARAHPLASRLRNWRIMGFLATFTDQGWRLLPKMLYTRYPIVARALGLAFRPSARASKGILHTRSHVDSRIFFRSLKFLSVITTFLSIVDIFGDNRLIACYTGDN